MKDERIKRLEDELKYLVKEERKKEIELYTHELENNANVKNIAKEIYAKRGIDYKKLNQGFINNIMDTLETFSNIFRNKDAKTRNKMILELLYIVLVLALVKLPFDLIRDIGYDYIKILTTNNAIEVIWNLVFLLLYTLTLVCLFIILIKNFNNKYKD